jgi:hypothetical protein
LTLLKEVEHWSLTTLREKLVRIGAKVVSHGRWDAADWSFLMEEEIMKGAILGIDLGKNVCSVAGMDEDG